MRRWWPWGLLLLVVLGGVGGYLYNEKMETGEIARAVWQELEGRGYADEAGEEALFQDLKPGQSEAAQLAEQAAVPSPSQPPRPVQPPSEKVAQDPGQPAADPPKTPTPPPPGETATDPPRPAPQPPAASPGATPQAQASVVTKAAQPAPVQPSPAKATPRPVEPAAGRTAQVSARPPGGNDGGSMRPNPFSNNVHILLIGNDQEKIGSGRADSIMLVTLNPDRRAVELLSIPRDTRVDIPGHGLDKVNHAYQFGGASLLNRTLQRFLGFPFQYYAEISYGGFRQMIDEVGGVDVEVPFSFDYEGFHFEKGPMHLGGKAALAYSRMRMLDPRGAFGREDRHQQIIRALMGRLADIPLNDTVRLNDFARGLIPFIRTDLGPMKIVGLRRAHPYTDRPPVKLSVRGHGQTIGGIYYFIVSDAERRRLHLALR